MKTSIRIVIAAMAAAVASATHAQPVGPSGTVLWFAVPTPTQEGPQAGVDGQIAQGAPSGSVLWLTPSDLGQGVEWFSQQVAQGGAPSGSILWFVDPSNAAHDIGQIEWFSRLS